MIITKPTQFPCLPYRTYLVVVDGATNFVRYKNDGTTAPIPDGELADGDHRRLNTISKGNVILAIPTGASSDVQIVQLENA